MMFEWYAIVFRYDMNNGYTREEEESWVVVILKMEFDGVF